ncbi:unnamed protein product [Rotaria magnacalcarata]|uniref:Uncharacterized protein n=1 Tax=Rotaria magnacalcarata TaxID=392030 RepID=A0A816P6V9_9BILA|nr:unnamed protein product [Rotaria magnacalcarata]
MTHQFVTADSVSDDKTKTLCVPWNNRTDARELASPTNTDYYRIYENIADGMNDNVNGRQISTNYGETLPVNSNQKSSSIFHCL